MVLSGDVHLAIAAGVRVDYDDPDAPDVANEIVTTSISSRFEDAAIPLFEQAFDKAGWVRYGNPTNRGYAMVTVTNDSWTTSFRTVDVKVSQADVITDFTDVVLAREPVTLPPEPPTATPPTPTPEADPATPVAGSAAYTG